MTTLELLAREASAVRAGTRARTETLRREVRGYEKQAAALAAYGLACLVMVLLVASAVDGGGSGVAPAPEAAREAPPAYHTVAKDETLAAIAERFGLTVAEIRRLNEGIDPLALAPGTELRLQASAAPVAAAKRDRKPKQKAPQAAAAPAKPVEESVAAASASGSEPAAESALQASGTHNVSPGDTLSAIAGRYGTTVEALLELNPGVDPYALKSGQAIRVP